MKTISFMIGLVLIGTNCFAQNKTLGVGISTPNPNAALHVESPGNNQGVLIPRLTTTLRDALTGTLAPTDIGLIVFDTDARALAIWNGTSWDIGSKVGAPINIINGAATGSAALVENNNTANPSSVFEAKSNTNAAGGAVVGARMTGTGGPAGYFEITNAATTNPALMGTTNSNVGGSLAPPAVYGLSTGTGSPGGVFRVNNPASTTVGLYAESNSATAMTASIQNINTGSTGPLLNLINSGTGNAITANRPIQSTQLIGVTATGGPAGYFEITNNTNTNPALMGATNSNVGGLLAPPGVYGLSTGTGSPGGAFRVNNTASTMVGLYAESNSTTAAVAAIQNINAASTGPLLNLINSGTGNAITANRPIQATQFIGDGSLLTGISGGLTFPFANSSSTASTLFDVTNTGTGQAGSFSVNNAASSSAGLRGTTNGLGPAILGVQNGNGSASSVGLFFSNSATNPAPGLEALIEGTGNVIKLTSNNAANTAPAINILHNGTGNAITANRPIQATQFIGDGSLLTGIFALPFSGVSSFQPTILDITSTNVLAGGVATFSITNGANTGTALTATSGGSGRAALISKTNAGSSSPALEITHAGTGNAITANRPIQATSFVGDGSALTNVIPSGIIMPFAGATAPAGYLLCDGSAVSRATYANLFAAIGTSWGVGDGSTTFNLPDLRGRFLRGVDGVAGNDPDAATRTANNGGSSGNNVGSYQIDGVPNITGSASSEPTVIGYFRQNVGGTTSGAFKIGATQAGNRIAWEAGTSYRLDFDASQVSSVYGASPNEARPKNAYVNYIIKL